MASRRADEIAARYPDCSGNRGKSPNSCARSCFVLDHDIVDLDDQIKQEDAGLSERGGPSRAKQRVSEITAFSRSQNVKRDAQLAHFGYAFRAIGPVRRMIAANIRATRRSGRDAGAAAGLSALCRSSRTPRHEAPSDERCLVTLVSPRGVTHVPSGVTRVPGALQPRAPPPALDVLAGPPGAEPPVAPAHQPRGTRVTLSPRIPRKAVMPASA